MTINNEKPKYLVESCLLTFGLMSVSNGMMLENWLAAGAQDAFICWVENGEIELGRIEEYLAFRARRPSGKFSCDRLDTAVSEKMSGALTASGTLEVCRRLGIPYAVSCGLGGIGDIKGEELCPDLPALRDLGVVLVGTSPKDMLDMPATIKWLVDNGVAVLGDGTDLCTGYVFNGESVPLSGVWHGENKPPLLILREIPAEARIKDACILSIAISDAKEAENRGAYYHPAANASIDKQTKGYSSKIQLFSLLDNILFASRLSAASH